MDIIDKMIITKTAKLLDELDRLATEATEILNQKITSTRVSDLTSTKEVPPHILLRIATIEFELSIMRRLMRDEKN